ncbi:SDR family oxidoreductase [Sphingomonas hankookensis]|uniref:SDR family oxidoreductase n=1 Tax=Sphingomonas hankookensis TaxID=563996 RepID=UPI003D3021B4
MLHASPNIASGIEVIDPADIGTPADIAALALFLASDAARFVSGAELVADGGRIGRL